MQHEKFEPRLNTFIEHQKFRATSARKVASSVDDAPIDVTISHVETLHADQGQRIEQLDALTVKHSESMRPVTQMLTKFRAKAVQHSLTNAITTSVTPRQLYELADLDDVKLIRLERPSLVTCIHETAHIIESIDTRRELGATGRGIRVAVLDSGIDENHPALLGKVVDRFASTSESLTIPGNHATHVAGTIASNDVVNTGIAPNVDLINIKVLTSAGLGTPANVITGLEQAVRRGAQVANLSLGWSEIAHAWVCNDGDCILCQAADNAVRLGVTVVVAAGNEGLNAGAPPFAVRHPGAARLVITVGAVDKSKNLAIFSSIGPASSRLSPTSTLRLTKPDVSAPGVNIQSSVLGGTFAQMSGTSMAAPHVAAVAALILQKAPALTPHMVKKILQETCETLDYTPIQAGYGVINAFASVMQATMLGHTTLAAESVKVAAV